MLRDCEMLGFLGEVEQRRSNCRRLFIVKYFVYDFIISWRVIRELFGKMFANVLCTFFRIKQPRFSIENGVVGASIAP